jgi:hypothetical protein
MITVTISINDQVIFTRSARNITNEEMANVSSSGPNLYAVDDGSRLTHRRSEGAVKLAIKMLKTIKEP